MNQSGPRSSFLKALEGGRNTKSKQFLRERVCDGSMDVQWSLNKKWEVVFLKSTEDIDKLWLKMNDTKTARRQRDYFVKHVLCNKATRGLVFHETTPKGEKVTRTFEFVGNLKKPVEESSHPLLQSLCLRNEGLKSCAYDKHVTGLPRKQICCWQDSAVSKQTDLNQETMKHDGMEVRGCEMLGPPPKRYRNNMQLKTIQRSTVQESETVENHHLYSFCQPDTLNEFTGNPGGLPPSYGTEDDIEHKDLELCDQLAHDQDVDALLSSINVNALLNSTEDTEDGIGQRQYAYWRQCSPDFISGYPDSEAVDVYPDVLDSNNVPVFSNSGHAHYFEDNLQCGTVPYQSQSEVASSKENDRMQCSANDISDKETDDTVNGNELSISIRELTHPCICNVLYALADSGHYQASQEGSTSPDSINCGHVLDLPGYIDLLTSLDGDETDLPGYIDLLTSLDGGETVSLISPMTELVISPSCSSCKGGERLVVTGVQPKDGEKYYIRFEGKQGRRCVSAEVEGTVLCARSPSYPSPEIVEAYVDVVDSNQAQSNGMAPVEFEFTDYVHLLDLYWHQLALQFDLESRLFQPSAMSVPKLKGSVHSASEILPEPAWLKAYEMEVHARVLKAMIRKMEAQLRALQAENRVLEAMIRMKLMWKGWCEDDCSDYTCHFQSKIKQLRGQGTPINSKLIDEISIFINHVGLNKGTLLQLAKRLGLDVEKHFKQSNPAECNEDDDTEVATLHQVKELLAIAGTTGLCIEEIIACVRGLQESSCRVDFLEIPDCLNMDVLDEFEELIVGMKACQLENRSHSLSEPCDILIAEEGVQNSCEEIWNDAGHCGMDALHEFEELIVGMEASQPKFHLASHERLKSTWWPL